MTPADEGESAPAAPPPAGLGRLLAPSLLLALGALALAWRERPHLAAYRSNAFRLLFARDEPAGAALLVVLLLAALALAWLLPGAAGKLPALLARRAGWVAFAAFLLLALGALTVYQARPLAMDEYAPWFQAHAFAAGHLGGRLPPDLLRRLLPPWLLFPFFTASPTSGAVISNYWPGFALLLAPAAALDVPWLLDPLLGAGCLLLLAALAARWTGVAAAAGWALLLTLASPAFTVNAFSFYPLTAHLLCNLLWMALLVEGRATTGAAASGGTASDPRLTGRPGRLLGAGAVGSLALVLHNPVPHAAFALPWIVALVRRRGWRPTLLLALGYLPLVLLLGIGWVALRQHVGADAVATVGAVKGAAAEGTLLDRASALAGGAFSLPHRWLLRARLLGIVELVTWAAPFLPVLAIFGWRATRRGSPLRLLAASAASTLLVYCFVPFDQGHGWGYRYFHAVWGALPLLGAAALIAPRAARWRGVVLAGALLALPAANALRAAQVRSFVATQRAQLPPVPATGRHLCFVSLFGGSYRVDLLQNDPFLRNRVWMLASAGFASDAALVARRFPGARLEL
ncbi:MAG TPA: hypothetical protein VGV61_15965, partial [Thermoanaerobaculia bacterium]|nr:hypothetical protein [Thermoanaerobaculia bacterium]